MLYLYMALLLSFPVYSQSPVHLDYESIKPSDTAGIIKAINNAERIPDADSAILTLRDLLELCKQHNFSRGTIQAYLEIGIQCSKLGNGPSLYYNRTGIAYINHIDKYKNYLAGFYINIAYEYSAIGIYDSAIIYNYKAVEAIERYNPVLYSKLIPYNNLGNIYTKIGQHEKAIDILKKVIVTAKEENNDQMRLAALVNLGVIYTIRKNYALAESSLQQAMDMEEARERYPAINADILASYANLYQRMNEPEKAIPYYKRALEIHRGDIYKYLTTYANLANCYYDAGDYKNAAAILVTVLPQAKKIKADFIPNIYGMLARTYAAQGRMEKALPYYNAYIEMQDSLQNSGLLERYGQLQFQLETAQKDNELIKKELLISRQKVSLQNRNLIIYTVSGLSIAFIGIIVIYFRNRRKTEKQQEERARWQATLEGEETERKRLAKELHDNIGGTLSTVKMWFQTIGERSQLSDSRQEYGEALTLLDTALNEVRNTAHNLMPELLLSHGLAEAVRIFCGNVQRATGIEVDYRYLGYIGDIEKGTSLVIYRTVQELVQNVVKHAKATHLLVQLSMHEDTLSLTVEDNGKGMDLALLPDTEGIGLRSTRNNIEKSGGDFQIHSEAGNGTTVDIDIVLGQEVV